MENKNQKSNSNSNSNSKSNSKSSTNCDIKKNKNEVEKMIDVKLTKNIKENKKENKKDNNIIFIVVERNGTLKETEIKENQITSDELSKKCKFKKPDGFIKRTQWNYSSKNNEEKSSSKIIIELWAKDDGIANYENKYEFPPPVDNELFFGCCALIAKDSKNNYVNLKKEKWNKIYEYLFGGFESLVGNEDDDDDEEDELDSIPSNRKTRDGYLKDGFVVEGGAVGDSEIDEESDNSDDDSDNDIDDDSDDGDGEGVGEGDEDCDDGAEDTCSKKNNKTNLVKNKIIKNKQKGRNTKDEDDDNSGWKTDESSELSEEEYIYSK